MKSVARTLVKRAQAWTKSRPNKMVNQAVVNRRTVGRHFYKDVVLVGSVRRLTMSDAGFALGGVLDGCLSEEAAQFPFEAVSRHVGTLELDE